MADEMEITKGMRVVVKGKAWPEMIVAEIIGDDARCIWTDIKGKPQTETYPIVSLAAPPKRSGPMTFSF